MQTGSTTSSQWSLCKLLHRFIVCYFLVFIFPFPINYIPFIKVTTTWYEKVFDALITWTGSHIFSIPFPLFPHSKSSGDAIYNYVQLFLFFILAVVLTVIWRIVKQRKKDGLLLYWLFIYIRFFFALTMIRYGLIKIVKAQFPFPFYSLNETYGESSPLRLFINFMGYSKAYNLFIGAGEVVAGILVLFRKTTLLGALLSIAVLTNVVVLNFCFDVPVKLYATHLLLMAIFIAAPDAKRLHNFFILNKSVQAASIAPRFMHAKTNTVWYIIKILLTLCIVYSLVGNTKRKYYFYGDGAFAKTPLFGLYTVEAFVKNGDTLPPLITDAAQWRMLNIVYNRQATLKMMDDNLKVCKLLIDTAKQTMQLVDNNDSTYKAVLSYTKTDSLHLACAGTIKQDSVFILLQKQNVNKYELLKRGFHWINESPYKK